MGNETLINSSLPQEHLMALICTFRGDPVMMDSDLARLYGVETKVLNQSVKRNVDRFPGSFRFQLTDAEKKELVTSCDRFRNLKHASAAPYAFTEQGVAMLSAVLRSKTAVRTSISIINAFVGQKDVSKCMSDSYHAFSLCSTIDVPGPQVSCNRNFPHNPDNHTDETNTATACPDAAYRSRASG